MKFSLEINLGNDAMRTYGDIAGALRRVAANIEKNHDFQEEAHHDAEGDIKDPLGNSVGSWAIAGRFDDPEI